MPGLIILIVWTLIVATGGDPAEGRMTSLLDLHPQVYRVIAYGTGILAGAWALFLIVSVVYEAWTGRELFAKALRNRPFIETPAKRSTPDPRDDRAGG